MNYSNISNLYANYDFVCVWGGVERERGEGRVGSEERLRREILILKDLAPAFERLSLMEGTNWEMDNYSAKLLEQGNYAFKVI